MLYTTVFFCVFSRICWEVQTHPGSFRIHSVLGTGVVYPRVKYDREGREATITTTVQSAQLQVEVARLLLQLLSLHPRFSDLPQNTKEVNNNNNWEIVNGSNLL